MRVCDELEGRGGLVDNGGGVPVDGEVLFGGGGDTAAGEGESEQKECGGRVGAGKSQGRCSRYLDAGKGRC